MPDKLDAKPDAKPGRKLLRIKVDEDTPCEVGPFRLEVRRRKRHKRQFVILLEELPQLLAGDAKQKK